MIFLLAIGMACAFQSSLKDEDKDSKIKEYSKTINGIYAEAYSDRKNYGFYSVTAQDISDDIEALEGIYDLMEDDEVVVLNDLKYSKEDIAEYIDIEYDLRSNFEDGEALVIYGGSEGSDIVTMDELEQLEEQYQLNHQI